MKYELNENESIYEPEVYDGSTRIEGESYHVTKEEIEFFHKYGYLTLRGVLSEEEMKSLEEGFDKLCRGEIKDRGKDFCDMSGSHSQDEKDFILVNAMLPRKYLPSMANNIYEKRAKSIASQLIGEDIGKLFKEN
eukprot:TRINITY_DN2720_c0_g1_i1.p1 TRINITY_DN2720_c0_g1~~TRINITY_DN2720_c0_g1_i1.p1  ORF type:complete len:135 (+),score=32.20 TRINITY_DN2720_c0_g1_i1:7-411(+)